MFCEITMLARHRQGTDECASALPSHTSLALRLRVCDMKVEVPDRARWSSAGAEDHSPRAQAVGTGADAM